MQPPGVCKLYLRDSSGFLRHHEQPRFIAGFPSLEDLGPPRTSKQERLVWLVWLEKACLSPLTFCFKEIYLFQRYRKGGGEGEKHQLAVSHMPPTRDLANNQGMCPDWGSNQQPSDSQANAQPTEPHQPGLSPLTLEVGMMPSLLVKKLKPLGIVTEANTIPEEPELWAGESYSRTLLFPHT